MFPPAEIVLSEELERRQYRRYPIRWQVAILFGKEFIREIYHGHTQHLSLGGASIFCRLDTSMEMNNEVIIFLFSASPESGRETTRIEISAKILCITPASDMDGSLLRVKFTAYRNEGRNLLSSLLSHRPHDGQLKLK